MTLPVTAFVAAICALLLLATAIDTVRQRLRLKAAFGDHGDAKLISASRSHGNLAEYAPITIILLGLLETARANHMALMVIGAIFLVGRVAHVIGLYTPSEPGKAPLGRQVGVAATFGTLLILGLWTLWMLATTNL
ncbi:MULTISPECIES: MAPEG family protein [unclassified Sphingopyxis]|uniref:MAPEG family protein n=1 Tax=unclassified Sphingopyxis TaxID=2614943 RepID=UPI00286701DC|nr:MULTISPECIES: MAPEG family protein [unclassified Sphingopyxis]MDR7059884.1 putative membrane protein YecN with MAPEG domain [Sphingopyxis sp. BE235]MDR7180604.1 putative membrane protein YecN with MAPEG domain [Sphingopyxis sp. BE249]